MFSFLNDLLTPEAIKHITDVYNWQNECNFMFMEAVSVRQLDITFYKNSMYVYLSKDTDGIGKDVHFYPEYAEIRTFRRWEHGGIAEYFLSLELRYDCTEEGLFQLSTVHDTTGIDLDTIKLFKTIRDTYNIRGER